MFFIGFLIYIYIFFSFYFKNKKDVSANDITQLPYQIGALSNLRTLNIRRNMIIELPTGKYKNLNFKRK